MERARLRSKAKCFQTQHKRILNVLLRSVIQIVILYGDGARGRAFIYVISCKPKVIGRDFILRFVGFKNLR